MAEQAVRVLVEDEAVAAADVLAAAFLPTSVPNHVLLDPARRADLVRAFFTAMTRLVARHGQALAIGDPPVAVALWFPPGSEPSEAEQAEAGIAEVENRLSLDELERWTGFNRHVSLTHEQVIPEPHWYLSFLAVHPAHQGTGVGTRLVRHSLEQIPLGAPCYLETADAPNVPFYERLGFRVVDESAVPGSTVRIWALRRDE